MTFLDRLNSPKLDFMQNRSGGKIIKFQQSQVLTSHFEIFWSIVPQQSVTASPRPREGRSCISAEAAGATANFSSFESCL